ncbi:hypothetical protein D3C76_1109790 [compost metagenome]
MDLLAAQARTAATLEQAQGNLPRITDIGNEIAVFTAAGAQVIGLVIVTVEEVVRGDVFKMVEALRQTALHRQTKGIEQVARGEVAIEDGVAVLLGNALLVQQLRRPPLALEADHHRLDRHQLADGRGQMPEGIRRFAMGKSVLQRCMPLLQGAKRQTDRGFRGCVAHAPQSNGWSTSLHLWATHVPLYSPSRRNSVAVSTMH